MEKVDLVLIMKTCVILYRISVEDERESCELGFEYKNMEGSTVKPNAQVPSSMVGNLLWKSNLVEEIWKL